MSSRRPRKRPWITGARRTAQVTNATDDIARSVCDDTHRRDDATTAESWPAVRAVVRSGAPTNWFRRASPARRAAVILGSVTLSVLLLCCTGTAIISALAGDPEPTRTGTAAEAQQPIVAAPAEPTEGADTQAASPLAAPSATLDPSDAVPASPTRPTPCPRLAPRPRRSSG